MTLVEHGTIHEGRIIFTKALDLPEGTEVQVRIAPMVAQPEKLIPKEEYANLPLLLMLSERENKRSNATVVREAREEWLTNLTETEAVLSS